MIFSFFFQAEDGIRDIGVTGVQTCALPIFGATIRQKGTQGGTITDLDGRYTLMADEGSELEISYIGYETRNIRVTPNGRYNITMTAGTAKELNEVVVTALGIKREEKALSYNVQQIKGDRKSTRLNSSHANISYAVF